MLPEVVAIQQRLRYPLALRLQGQCAISHSRYRLQHYRIMSSIVRSLPPYKGRMTRH